MDESYGKPGNMIETTDCLEAVGVFRSWKNFFFLAVLVCLLLAQGSFWAVDTKWVEIHNTATGDPNTIVAGAEYINEANKRADDEANQPREMPGSGSQLRISSLFALKFGDLTLAIEVVNGVLLVTATLYCLAMLFSLQVSLIGRLGGINHISRAFFLSLVMLVLLIPWQKIIGHSVIGAMYTPGELAKWYSGKGDGILDAVLYYLRFCGYWAVVAVLLVFSQVRSYRWSKTILRRLELI